MGIGAVVPVVEALGRGLLGTPLISTTLAGQLLMRADAGACESILARIASGTVAAVALLESDDWGAPLAEVTLDADGVLTGSKRHVTDASVADVFVVVASKNGEPVLAVVEREALTADAVTPHALIDLTKRAARVDFSGSRALLVLEGENVARALSEYRLIGALLTAAEATGTAASCLATITDYLKTRKQFGKLIGSYQALKHPTVDIYCGLENARTYVYHAATLVGSGPLSKDAEIACRMAKVAATDLMEFAGDRSVQFHGGIGFTWDCDSMLYIRRAQWTRQVFGDALQHRSALAQLLLD
jgi:alkylation response protein AidB-like acyl-CoA dehydrogenase